MVAIKILLVEDEAAIAEVEQAYLVREGFEVRVVYRGDTALDVFRHWPCDLIVLDLMLPGLSGLELCAEIRRHSDVPIVMVTALSGEDEVIAGLDCGADDYVVKPFSPRVLVARVKANLRRDAVKPTTTGHAEGLVINELRREVQKDGHTVKLTRNEFLLLSVLAARPEKTFSRDELITRAFGDDYTGFDRAIDSYIKNIRRKLADSRHPEGYIRTVHGFGYRYEA